MPDMHTGGPILVERFSCAPGPVGWRYAATVAEEATGVVRGRVDVTVDARWRQARVELRAGAWLLRGGVAGRELLWVRGGADGAGATEHAEVAAAFTGTSPAFLVTTARMLGLVAGESASVELVAITGDALATRTVRQRWSYVEGTEHKADVGPLRVARFAVADLDTGTVGDVYLAGDVVLAAPGIELRSLESPPNLSNQAGAW
jgi:hypothetical protein